MCGILGAFGQRPSDTELGAALDLLIHRGPDDRGIADGDDYWLGHRRLSIIDGAGGHQPMTDPATGVCLSYNGEIYNYLELRRELESHGHRFTTRSDTEVLLRAYLEWDEDCLGRLNGMWAFAIWDPRRRQAFFARDRFGVKPLYWALTAAGLLLASEPKALLAARPELRAVDEEAIWELLANRRAHHDGRSFYRCVNALPAGHCGTYAPNDPTPRLRRYWHPPEPTRVGEWDERDALEQFSALLEDAVSLRLRSDVPVGVTVSGGVDSTLILDAMAGVRAAAGDSVAAYTAAYNDGFDERAWARTAVSRYDNATLTGVRAEVGDWLEVLRRVVWHMDGPGISPAVFPMWMIMQRAREDGVPVLLEGQGADEQFGGYSHYPALAFLDRLTEASRPATRARGAVDAARAGARARSARSFGRDLGVAAVPAVRSWQLSRSTLRSALGNRANGTGRVSNGPTGPSSRLDRRLAADFGTEMLPAFLQYGDAISMAHSIETRLPFMDYRIVEFASALPAAAKIAAGETKHLLRSYLRHAGQQAIADRTDKRGYPTPANAWLAAGDGSILRELLLDRDARVRGIVDPARLERVIKRHAGGNFAAGDALYGLLATEIWWQQV